MTTTTSQFLHDVCAAGPQYYLSFDAKHNQQHKGLQTLESYGVAEQGRNVYFCPASFRAGGDRNDSGVVARRAFVLDVDVRPGEANHFHNTPDAIASVDHMVASGYAPPYAYMVDSGSGLHVYWLCDVDLDHTKWLSVNNGFINRWDHCGEPRLISDRKTSRRYSGLFRLPGTNNTKHGTPLPCRLVAGSGVRLPQDWVDFWIAEGAKLGPAQVNTTGNVVALPAHVQAQVQPWALGAPMNQRMVCKEDPVVVDPKPMIETCKVLQEVINNPTQYNEPSYLEVARALSTARDGRRLFHRIAAFDAARYTADWADEKFDHATSGFDKPVNCRNLRDAITQGRQDLCQGCPMFRAGGKPRALQSAFELRGDHTSIAPAQPMTYSAVVGDEYPFVVETPTNTIPSNLDSSNPHNEFFVNPAVGNALCQLGPLDPSGMQRSAPQFVSDEPFWFSKMWGAEDKRHWQDRRVTVTRLDTRGSYESFEVDPSGVVEPKEFIKRAAFGGLTINGSAKNTERLRRYLLSSMSYLKSQPDYRALTYDKLGWKRVQGKRTFLLGDEMFKGGRQIGQSRADDFAELITDNWGIGRSGSYQAHLDAVMTYNHPDIDPSVKMSLLLGLGSPLLSMLNSRTTFIMLRGEGGVGKSETMKVVLSLYGRPEHTLLSSSDTERGMAGGIAGANHMALYFDEVTTQDKEDFRDMLLETNTSGRRLLANRDSSAKKGNDSSSCTFVLVSSNKSLVEFIPGLHDADIAAKSRCLEIPFDKVKYAPHWEKKFTTMQDTLVDNHGWLGAVFIDYVIDNYDTIRDQIKGYYQTEFDKAGNNGKRRFDCRAIAVARMTEQIMQDLGWMTGTSWTDDALTQSKLRLAIADDDVRKNAPVSTEDQVPLSSSQQMESFLGDMVASNKDAFVTVTDGIVPDTARMMRKVAGILIVDTKSHTQPVEQLIVFNWFLDEYAGRHDAGSDRLVNAWRANGHSIKFNSRYPARQVTKINGLQEKMAVWEFPSRYTEVPK